MPKPLIDCFSEKMREFRSSESSSEQKTITLLAKDTLNASRLAVVIVMDEHPEKNVQVKGVDGELEIVV